MFCSWRTAKPAQRALDALRLARSFLLLEDDYVDWEVDRDEPGRGALDRPHRTPLRGRFVARRSGQPAPAPQVCLTPVSRVHLPPARARRPSLGGRAQSALDGRRGWQCDPPQVTRLGPQSLRYEDDGPPAGGP
jgi:hypothetical protein